MSLEKSIGFFPFNIRTMAGNFLEIGNFLLAIKITTNQHLIAEKIAWNKIYFGVILSTSGVIFSWIGAI